MAHRLAPTAEADLEDIWYYVANASGSVDIADRLIDAITQNFATLAQFPHMGRRRDREQSAGLRSFPIGDYIVFYRVAGPDVLILRVIRGSRDIEALFKD